MYYYRARYYSPELKRFISEDPIGVAGGINFFVYVGNNPVNRIDPMGYGFFDGAKCKKYAKKFNIKACTKECGDSLEDMIGWMDKYGGNWYSDTMLKCVCSKMGKLGPKKCAELFKSCIMMGLIGPPRIRPM